MTNVSRNKGNYTIYILLNCFNFNNDLAISELQSCLYIGTNHKMGENMMLHGLVMQLMQSILNEVHIMSLAMLM